MTCAGCGAQLNIGNRFCPYCGRPNEAARKYHEDMQKYDSEFRRTRDEVMSVRLGLVGVVVRLIVVAALIVGIAVSLFVAGHAYEIAYNAQRRTAASNYNEWSKKIEEYMAAGDYIGLASFADANNIDYYDSPYGDYEYVLLMSDYYSNIYIYAAEVMEESAQEITDYGVSSLTSSVTGFYELMKSYDARIEKGYTTNKCPDAITDMKNNAELILRTYIGLTQDETDSLYGLSSNRVSVIIEDAALARAAGREVADEQSES